MRIVAPPDHLHGDRRGVAQRPEDDAVAPVLGRGAFRGDADAATGRSGRLSGVALMTGSAASARRAGTRRRPTARPKGMNVTLTPLVGHQIHIHDSPATKRRAAGRRERHLRLE
jgi:hypothetical protein